MKHVFVETNFLIDVLRPFPQKSAEALLARNGRDVLLHLPWCSVTEAKRTIERVIREDLAFVDGAGRFAGYLGSRSRDKTELAAVQPLIEKAREMRRQALFDFVSRVDSLASKLAVVEPSTAVVRQTVTLFPVKSLPPFDEMVLGAVLAEAARLHGEGEREIYFCNLNKNDFQPSGGNGLGAAYAAAGIEYLDSFAVP